MNKDQIIKLQANFIEMQQHTITRLQEELDMLWEVQQMDIRIKERDKGKLKSDEIFFAELEIGWRFQHTPLHGKSGHYTKTSKKEARNSSGGQVRFWHDGIVKLLAGRQMGGPVKTKEPILVGNWKVKTHITTSIGGCPRCGEKQYFVCRRTDCACHTRVPEGTKPQIYVGNDAYACPYCGFTEHIDFWGERELNDALGKTERS